MHVHVQSADEEAKFWLEPSISSVQNHGLKARAIFESLCLIRDYEQAFRNP